MLTAPARRRSSFAPAWAGSASWPIKNLLRPLRRRRLNSKNQRALDDAICCAIGGSLFVYGPSYEPACTENTLRAMLPFGIDPGQVLVIAGSSSLTVFPAYPSLAVRREPFPPGNP